MASAVTGEVMNLLARRNLLFQVVPGAVGAFRINIAMGSPDYPREEAADPSAFALKIRRQLTDEQRTLRVYGSEVVICRLTGDARADPAASPQLRRPRDRGAAHQAARRLRQGRRRRRRRRAAAARRLRRRRRRHGVLGAAARDVYAVIDLKSGAVSTRRCHDLRQDVLEELAVGARVGHRLFRGRADLAALDHDRSIEAGGFQRREDAGEVHLSRCRTESSRRL